MDDALREKLEDVERSYEVTLEELADQSVIADSGRYQEVMIRHGELRPIVEAFRRSKDAQAEADEAAELAKDESDAEMRSYLDSVALERRQEVEELDGRLRTMLVPKDPNDEKDVIVELRAAAGGVPQRGQVDHSHIV